MTMDSNGSECALFSYELFEPPNARELDSFHPTFLKAIASIQLVISCLGIAGNLLSLVVLATTKSLHTIPNLYIGMLATVDLIVCLIIPMSVAQILLPSERYTFSEIGCRIIGYVLVMSLSQSLFCMMLIAINRYILIVKGRTLYNRIYTKRNTFLIILLANLWLFIIIVVIPETTKFGRYGYNSKFGVCFVTSYCFKNYIYVSCLLTLTVFGPVAVTTGFTYIRIIQKLVKMRKKIQMQEKASLSPPAAMAVEYDGKDSGVELSRGGAAESSADDDEHVIDEEDEKEVADREESMTGSASSSQSDPSSPVASAVKQETGYELITRVEEVEPPNQEVRSAEAYQTPRRSFLRSLSSAKFVVKSRILLKLRRPQWNRLRKTITNMITIYVVLWVCWLPLVLEYLIDMHGRLPAFSYKIEVTLIYFNSAFNVLLYALMNNSHRKAYRELLTKCCRKRNQN